MGALARLAHGGWRVAVCDEAIRREPACEAWLLDTPGVDVRVVTADDVGAEPSARLRVLLVLADHDVPAAWPIAPPAADVTLVAAGAAVPDAVSAADLLAREHGLAAEIVVLADLAPLDLAPVLASVARTHRCVVVEVGRPAGGLGAVVAAAVGAAAFDDLDGPVARADGEAVLAAALDLR